MEEQVLPEILPPALYKYGMATSIDTGVEDA